MVLLHRQGQPNRDRHALVHAFAGCLYGPVIGGHKGAGNPESQTEARSYLGVTISTEELLSQQRPVVGVKPGPLVGDRNYELAGFIVSADTNGGLRRRIFRRIVENLPQRPLHQYGIDPQEDEFLRKRHLDRAARQAVATTLKRRIDEVGGLRPFELRLKTVAADARGVENILDLDIEPLRFLMDQRRELLEARIAGNLRRQRQYCRCAED